MCRVSKQAYPAVFDIYNPSNDTNHYIEKVHQKNIQDLVEVLAAKIMDEIEDLMEDVTGGGVVTVSPDTVDALLHDVVMLGEKEPCGVRGGSLVVSFTDSQDVLYRLGSISLDPYIVETYQLELDLFESKEAGVRMINGMRKMWSQPRKVVVDKFCIKKKKLYRGITYYDQ